MAGGSTTPRNLLLPIADKLRGIPGLFGIRLYNVTIIVRTWTGTRPGLGTASDKATGVKVDIGVFPTKVTQVSSRDAIASGGLYTNMDLRVGPITPPFTGSTQDGNAIAVLDPPQPAPGFSQEVLFNIQGPGFPTTASPGSSYAGAFFEKISSNFTKAFRYEFIVTKTGKIA